MKRGFYGCTAGLLVGMALLNGCKKSDGCNLIPATIVRIDCGLIIMEAKDSRIRGDATWTDVLNGRVYTNVIADANTCRYNGLAAAAAGSIIYIDPDTVTYGSTAVDPGCVQCLAASSSPPSTLVKIGRVGAAPCE